MMKQTRLLFLLIAALAFDSCRPTAQQTVADAEQRVNDVWTILPIKPRKDGAVYAFNDIGYELAPHSTRLFTIHVEPDKYDFERGQKYRIVKEFFKSGQSNPQSAYCNFTIE